MLTLALVVMVPFVGQRVTVEHCEVEVADLHPDLDGLRIVQFTDFHASRIGPLEEAALAAAAELRPDLVVCTGDLACDVRVAEELCRRMVSLGAPLGCFAVMGNAEYDCDAEALVGVMRRAGVTVLRNEARLVGRGEGKLWIIGVDDPSTGRSFLEGALLQLQDDHTTPRLLLAHFPTVFRQAVIWGIDVVLAGHTHGGQIVVPWVGYRASTGSPESDRYVRGDFREGTTWMHVSRGIGTSRIPVRLGAPPEVTLITLRRVQIQVVRPLPTPSP